jgi:serine protease Do
MSLKNVLNLSVSLLLTAGVAFAQQPSTQAPTTESNEPFGAFSLFFEGEGFLGVYAEEINKDNLAQYGLRDTRGVGVTEVVKDSPADKAGLRKGDVITRFDNEPVSSVRKLNRLVAEVAPDHKVTVGISRGGSEQELAVTVGKRAGYADTTRRMTIPHGNFPMEGFPMIEGLPYGNFLSLSNGRRIGVGTTQLTKQLADYFGVSDGKGVLVTAVSENTPAAKAGIKAGDVITAVEGEKIESSGDLSRAINNRKDGEVKLTVVRDKSQRTIKLTPEKTENQLLRTGRIANGQILREQIRQGLRNGRIAIPRIELPSIPAMNISVPQIDLLAIPEINVVLPRVPRVRVIRTGRILI